MEILEATVLMCCLEQMSSDLSCVGWWVIKRNNSLKQVVFSSFDMNVITFITSIKLIKLIF